jgi:hypothetical protein
VCKPEAELGSALDRLIQIGLLFRQGVPPQATYLFKHALVRDVAYGTLLRGNRQQYHARIGQSLEEELQQTPPEKYLRTTSPKPACLTRPSPIRCKQVKLRACARPTWKRFRI